MNIIPMMNWTGLSSCSIRLINTFFVVCLLTAVSTAQNQNSSISVASGYSSNPSQHFEPVYSHSSPGSFLQDTVANDYPDPESVMYKSMIIPGWGQIANRQIWKVPIVYGLIGGLAGYSIFLHKRYHDFRAAYYNLNPQTPDDLRFGPTPDYIPQNANLESLRSSRNAYRNRRDMVYIGVVLAYGLNILDAYVFAHMRTFDVSEDLSMRTRVQPSVLENNAPGLSISIDLISK